MDRHGVAEHPLVRTSPRTRRDIHTRQAFGGGIA